MHTHPNAISESEAIAAWQEVVDATKEQPWLAGQVARGGRPLLERFLQVYQQLRAHRQWRRRLQRRWGVGLAALALLLALNGGPATANPATVIVVDGVVCTLGEAIASANNDNAAGNGCADGSGIDIIDLQVNVNVPNVLALPEITSVITLAGNGHTIHRTGGPAFSILRVAAAGDLTVDQVTISGGSASLGGGINNSGTLTVINSTITGNSAGSGGGIFNNFSGTMTVQGSTISGNSAPGGSGGGIFAGGTLTVQDSTISTNSAANGGGILSQGTLTVHNSTLSGNSATNWGGAISGYMSAVKVEASTISGNWATERGGGIQCECALTVQDSYLSGNSANRGGAIDQRGGLIVQNSTLSGNSANSNGGGIFSQHGIVNVQNSTLSGNSAGNNGGGLHNGPTSVTYYPLITTIENSTLSGNLAGNTGGGIFSFFTSTLSLQNSTLSTNAAVEGGGIFNYYGTLSVQNSTLSSNSALHGGGIHDAGAQAIVQSSIVALQLAGGDCSSSVGSNGYNIESGTSCGFTEASSQQNVSSAQLLLEALSDNGGPTQTMALGAGSVAIDQIPVGALEANGCGVTVTTDQRGAPRAGGTSATGGNACDVGAFEFGSTPLSVMLAYLDAQSQDGQVVLHWETVSEVNNAGFNLMRSTSPDVAGEPLAFVPSQAPGSTQGSAYSFVDSDVIPGQTYYYWLEDIDLNGTTTLHGPVSATVETPTAVTLSQLNIGNHPTKTWPGWVETVIKALREFLLSAYSR